MLIVDENGLLGGIVSERDLVTKVCYYGRSTSAVMPYGAIFQHTFNGLLNGEFLYHWEIRVNIIKVPKVDYYY